MKSKKIVGILLLSWSAVSWAADSQLGETEDNLDEMTSVETKELDGIETVIEGQDMEEQETEESPDRITTSEQISGAVSFPVIFEC